MAPRADVLLVEQGVCDSRAQAQRLIMAGKVRLGPDRVVRKASETLADDSELSVDQPCPYVSRGAYKLIPALDRFLPTLPPEAVVLDVGASTGGFTDLLLQRGAARSYAVDVGHGQLHYRLRKDERVVVLEKVNARSLSQREIPETADILVADVSFISLRKILPACAPLLKPGGHAFTLVKPQFEAQRREVDRGGVVRDAAVRDRCVDEISRFAEHEIGWTCLGTEPSPISGPKGNRETIAVFQSGRRALGASGL